MVEAGSLVSSKSELARKEKLKKKSKSGGFESLNLSPNVYRAIRRIGYKVPTPIQRKALPLILSGSDVVAMARTGSGKTAAFLIPIIERLKQHLPQNGVRALVLSPTRDLALQTLKFTKDLGRFTDIRTSLIVGGDSMDNQFEELSNSPDIIIATPGRLMHHLVEVDDLSLKSVECVVFDEADSLFDMGFSEQLHQILSKLGDNRQTLLFSATLPSALADFAKAGLKEPKLIRLDVETKISPDLKTTFFTLRQEEKLSALVYLVREIISPQEQTLIFVSTKHHVELLSSVFKSEDIEASVSYGDMDQGARKMHVSKFRARKSMYLIVTDVAARGIDIPLLDNVINWDFPPKPKIFVHRVGRAARAGRRGAAFSFVTSDDMPYLLDLHLFLSKPVMAAPSEDEVLRDFDGVMSGIEEKIAGGQTVYGRFPQSLIDLISDRLRESIESSAEISALVRTCANAFRLYTKTKPPPSKESIRRAKELPRAGVHPLFKDVLRGGELLALAFSQRLKSFRPKQTILEAEGDSSLSKKHKDSSVDIMAKKRAAHDELINNTIKQKAIKNIVKVLTKEAENPTTRGNKQTTSRGLKRKQETFKDEEYYISSIPANHFTEMGLSVKSNEFGANRLESAVLDLVADGSEGLQKQKSQYHWDKKSKKYVKLNNGDRVTATGKIKSESGAKVKAQKVGLYKKWKERSHKKISSEGGTEEPSVSFKGKYRKHQNMVPNGNLKSEIKDLEHIRKQRQKKEIRYSKKKDAPKFARGTRRNKRK